jgi:hypothetical protein
MLSISLQASVLGYWESRQCSGMCEACEESDRHAGLSLLFVRAISSLLATLDDILLFDVQAASSCIRDGRDGRRDGQSVKRRDTGPSSDLSLVHHARSQ